MTATTLPLLALIAFLWWRTKGDLLAIILFTSIFDAASAFNIAGSPISPWLFALALCLPIKLLQGKLHWKPVVGINRGALTALLLFVAYGALSSFICPFLFHGILVTNDRNGANVPLSWSLSNLSQLLYLLAVFTVFLLAIHSTREKLRNALEWYIRGCICIAFFSMYELAHMVLHVPYPSAVLYSNTSHVIFDAYKVNGLWRLNSTTSEASAVAFYVSTGLALLGWRLAKHSIRPRDAAAFLLMFVALVLTVSTTAYACMAALAIGGIALAMFAALRRGRLAPVKLLLVILAIAVIVPVFALTNAPHAVESVLQGVFVNKIDTESYRTRSLLNAQALQTARDSYYCGAGWGSVRASSFFCTVLANAGIPGMVLFLWFLVQCARPLLRPRRYLRFEMFEQACFGLYAVLVALAVATPDIIQPVIWTLFAIVTAAKPRRLSLRLSRPDRASEPARRPLLVARRAE